MKPRNIHESFVYQSLVSTYKPYYCRIKLEFQVQTFLGLSSEQFFKLDLCKSFSPCIHLSYSSNYANGLVK